MQDMHISQRLTRVDSNSSQTGIGVSLSILGMTL